MTRHEFIPKIDQRFTPIVKQYGKQAIGGVCTCTKLHKMRKCTTAVEATDSDGCKRCFDLMDFRFEKDK